MPVFETGAFNRSATPPRWDRCRHRQRSRQDFYAKWLKALLASAMRWVFSRFWIVVPDLL